MCKVHFIEWIRLAEVHVKRSMIFNRLLGSRNFIDTVNERASFGLDIQFIYQLNKLTPSFELKLLPIKLEFWDLKNLLVQFVIYYAR